MSWSGRSGPGAENHSSAKGSRTDATFLAEPWRSLFECNGLKTFEDFWQLKADWFEAPNERRGGWSGVARCELQLPQGGVAPVFLKRQENHITRTWRHPFRGMATLVREFDNLNRFAQGQIPTLRPLYFAVRRVSGNLRAILVTEELTGFRSLESLVREWGKKGWPALPERGRILNAVARAVRLMHDHLARHNCLYAKHIFVKWIPNEPSAPTPPVEVRIIDLEKSKWTRSSWQAGRGDLDALYRHSGRWRRTDCWRFLKAYLGEHHPVPAKEAWRIVARRSRRKLAKQGKGGLLV
jgi:hypothetical protein